MSTTVDDLPVDSLAPSRGHHLSVLAMSICVIGLSLLMTTLDNRRVAFLGFAQFPLPELCQSRLWLNMDCPGCGLTRSFIHFFHGHWRESFQMHRFGWLLAILTALQIPYRLLAVSTPREPPLGHVFPWAVGIGMAALLFLNWLLRLAGV